jgi:hypothetical protein
VINSTRLFLICQLRFWFKLEVRVVGFMESVVEPPVAPCLKCPPFLGTAAAAFFDISRGDTVAARPSAERRVINSRLLMRPSVNILSSDFTTCMALLLLRLKFLPFVIHH